MTDTPAGPPAPDDEPPSDTASPDTASPDTTSPPTTPTDAASAGPSPADGPSADEPSASSPAARPGAPAAPAPGSARDESAPTAPTASGAAPTEHGSAAEPGEAEPTVRLPTASAVPAAASAAAARVELRKGLGQGEDGEDGEDTGGPGHGPGSHRYPPAPGRPGAVRARRFWSGRRIPAALTAAAGLALSGLFLYDVSSVRAHHPAMQWRRTLADELATRHLDDPWIIAGASVCAVLGLWLLVLALTPGERGVLPMARRGPAAVRAGLDRHAAALVLRDRAMEVPGVRDARAVVGRRRITIRATSHFRVLADVERDLDAAMEAAVRRLGLARDPRLSVRLRRADKKA